MTRSVVWLALAMVFNASGDNNTAIASGAGSNLTSGDNNLYIGNPGEANESNTIRIGNNFELVGSME